MNLAPSAIRMGKGGPSIVNCSRNSVLPGVESATLADFAPLSFSIHSDDVFPDGYAPAARRIHGNQPGHRRS